MAWEIVILLFGAGIAGVLINALAGGFGVGFVALASIYGGFFGAGLGVILTAALSITEPNDIRTVKVLKNLLATCVIRTLGNDNILGNVRRQDDAGPVRPARVPVGYHAIP